jgi:hypothetical protein
MDVLPPLRALPLNATTFVPDPFINPSPRVFAPPAGEIFQRVHCAPGREDCL